MKQFFRDYFTFNKRERNGIFILLSIITVLVLYLNISDMFIRPVKVDFTKFENDIKAMNDALQQTKDLVQEDEKSYRSSEIVKGQATAKAERFNFNPNDLPEKEWKRLGLTDKQIHTIKNYESKGGTFRKKEDVKKMYCIKEELYISLEPYIQIPEENKQTAVFVSSKSVVSTPQPTIPIVELNSADSATLTTIKGIGPFFAKTIVKYRNAIGGFYAKEQLLEVWKFDQEKLHAIEKYITVDASRIKKVNINTCEAEQLKSLYIKWNLANAIVSYRKMHGNYKTIDEIKKTDLVDDETYRKIAPYLILE